MAVFVLTGKMGTAYTMDANRCSRVCLPSISTKVVSVSMVMAHIWLPGFYARAEAVLCQQPEEAPIVVTRGRHVMDASPGARKRGIGLGISLSAARLMCPEIVQVSYAPERYDGFADSLWEACAQHSPAVEPLAQHEAFIDLSGCADVPGVLERVSQGVESIIGSRPVFGVAGCKLVARVASGVLEETREVLRGKAPGASCRRAWSRPEGEGQGRHLPISPAREAGNALIVTGKEKEFLAPLPVGVLWTIDRDVIERLLRLGVQRVGDVQAMGRSALVDALGEAGHVVYEFSLGTDRSRVMPVYPKEAVTFRKAFDDEVSDEPILARIVESGAAFIEQRLRACAVTARRWGIVLELVSNSGASQAARERRLSKPPEFYGGVPAIYRSLLREVLSTPGGATPSQSESPGAPESPGSFGSAWGPGWQVTRCEPATCGLSRPVRAISLIAADLVLTVAASQVDMFDPHVAVDPTRAVDVVVGRVREKFGVKSLFPASLLECDRRDRLLLAWEACSYEESKQVASGCDARRPASGEFLLEKKMASGAFRC
ncbi:MAG: DNA polymerase Y family protein [Bacillota bacterium]